MVNKHLEYEGWFVMRFWDKDILEDPLRCAVVVLVSQKDRIVSQTALTNASFVYDTNKEIVIPDAGSNS